jgi:hypothetical protein
MPDPGRSRRLRCDRWPRAAARRRFHRCRALSLDAAARDRSVGFREGSGLWQGSANLTGSDAASQPYATPAGVASESLIYCVGLWTHRTFLMRTRTALVSLLAIALLAWFLRHANLADVGAQVRRARVDYLLYSVFFVAVTYWVRAWRWQFLLAPLGRPGSVPRFRTTVIGFAALSSAAGARRRPASALSARAEGKPPRVGNVRHGRHGACARPGGRRGADGDLRLGVCGPVGALGGAPPLG